MCEHCQLSNCSVLNKGECPINVLWKIDGENKATLDDVARYLEDNDKADKPLP